MSVLVLIEPKTTANRTDQSFSIGFRGLWLRAQDSRLGALGLWVFLFLNPRVFSPKAV